MTPSWLEQRCQTGGSQVALNGPWGDCTYAQLGSLCAHARRDLQALGLPAPTLFVIVGEHAPATVAWLFVLAEAGHGVAPLAGNPAEHPHKLAEVGAQWIITTTGLHWTILPRMAEPSLHPDFQRLRAHGQAGLVLFSSGTSGQPKAMVQNLTGLIEQYGERHPHRLRVLALLGFDHIGGLNTLLGALAAGTTIVVPPDRAVATVAAVLAEQRVGILPASPTFLNLFLVSGEHRVQDLSALRVITYGTEPMSPDLLHRLRAAFPAVRFIQTFGTSETGIARTESPDPGSTFLRFTDPNLEWKVVADELWLRSRTQVTGYLNAREGRERFTNDGWFRTGDKVELGPDQTLRILGRFGEIINVGGEKLLPTEVEAVLAAVPGVVDCRVLGEPNALVGQTVIAEVVAATGVDFENLRTTLRQACRRSLAAYKVPTRITFVASVSGARLKKMR